jgi:non-canonical (house-cleaning) NTP pyrophosphatase
VTHEGGGRYRVSCTVTAAGPVRIAVSLAADSAVRVFAGVCRAGPLALGRCTVADRQGAVTAGHTSTLMLHQADRW